MTQELRRNAVVYLLRRFADDLGDRVCNDFPEQKQFFETVNDHKEFIKAFHSWNGDPEEFDPDREPHIEDFCFTEFLAHIVEKEGC